MTDLTDFLLARIAEDEAEIAAGFDFATLDSSGWMGHAAGWGRERASAECEAKRRIVQRYQRAEAAVEADARRVLAGGYSDERGTVGGWDVSALRPVLRLLALPYADHPGYREEWRP